MVWQNPRQQLELPLSQLSRDFGATSLRLDANDHWHSPQPLWLIENQALFDQTNWLPADTRATLLFYSGQLDGRLLSWLANRPRASQILHFPDYDGVGLANFARLYARLGDSCQYWLMPNWSSKLARYGNPKLWRDSLRDFELCCGQLPDYLAPLTQQMHQSGLALEQEAIWLP